MAFACKAEMRMYGQKRECPGKALDNQLNVHWFESEKREKHKYKIYKNSFIKSIFSRNFPDKRKIKRKK